MYKQHAFTPLEKSTELLRLEADSGLIPLATSAVRGRVSLTGFTLMEMLVVLIIVGVITAMGVISLSFVPTRQTIVNTQKLAADLRWVRAAAVSSNSDYCVRFSEESGKYFYEVHKKTCSGTRVTKKSLEVPIYAPLTPFDIMFYTFDSAFITKGGTVYSDRSVDERLDIELSPSSDKQRWRVSVFETTGYIIEEKR